MKINEIENILNNLKDSNNFRKLRVYPEEMINFSSNDYLGIANDKSLREEFYNAKSPKLSSSSSRLITGCYNEVMELERYAEEIYGKACITFNSGFDANSSIIETFYNKNTLIISDRLNHASIYDGIINSGAKLIRYRHLDMIHLEEILQKNRDKYEDILVVAESVYSMDGDITDIKKIVELKRKYGFDFILDEAHSYGVYGYGMAYNMALVEDVDFLVIPLGKGGGSMGAMVICNQILKDFIINKSRKFIFSTALPPVVHAWNLFVLKNMERFENKREKLKNLIEYMGQKLVENHLITEDKLPLSHIVSIVIGDNKKIDILQNSIRNKGFLVYGVKEPTVPKNTARFRLSLNPDLDFEDLNLFVTELKNELEKLEN